MMSQKKGRGEKKNQINIRVLRIREGYVLIIYIYPTPSSARCESLGNPAVFKVDIIEIDP